MIKLLLHLEVGECNGVMDFKITDVKNRDYEIGKLSPGENIVELDVDTPNKLVFSLSGKQKGRDTILEKGTGKIVQDKFIKITSVEIDSKPLTPHRVAQMFVLHTETKEQINSAYWGFNGHVNFDLPYEDALDMHLSHLG